MILGSCQINCKVFVCSPRVISRISPTVFKGALYSSTQFWLNIVQLKNPGHVSFKFILAPVNKVSMATNSRLLSFTPKMKLVCHLLFDGHEIFSQASLVILLQKRVFLILIATSGVELCGDKQRLSRLSKSVSKNISLYLHTVQNLKVLLKIGIMQ